MKNKLRTQAFSNLVGAVIFLVLGIWAWLQTNGFKTYNSAAVQPAEFPRIMIGGMLIFSVILLIQSVLKLLFMKENDPLAEKAESIDVIHDRGVQAAAAVIVLCILFVALFKAAGYFICGAVVSFIIMFMIGKRNWVQMILVSILVPVGMWLIFYKALTVKIPLGPLGFLYDLI